MGYELRFVQFETVTPQRFMGSVTALLVLAALLGSMKTSLPSSSQVKLIDFWFIWYVVNIFFIIIFHVVIENLDQKIISDYTKEKVNRMVICFLPFPILVFNFVYFTLSVAQIL